MIKAAVKFYVDGPLLELTEAESAACLDSISCLK